jgi:hypothetical protein
MGDLVNHVTKSLSSILNLEQDSQQKNQEEESPFSFWNFGQATLQPQPNKSDDQYILDGQKVGTCEDAKQLQAFLQQRIKLERQRDFQGDVGILKEALTQLVDRKKEAPVTATKLAKDHKSRAAVKGKEIRKLCEERSARLPTTIQRQRDPSKEVDARILNLEAREKEAERERQAVDYHMDEERQKRRVEADCLTKTGKEHEENGDLHGAVAAYDRALRILLYGNNPTRRAPSASPAASASSQTSQRAMSARRCLA